MMLTVASGARSSSPIALGGTKGPGVMSDLNDRWAAGATYESFMGRWSRLVAPLFVSWLRVRSNADWLDVGCGTGALSEAICSRAKPASVVACDPSESFIRYAQEHHTDPRLRFVVAASGNLPVRPGGFDSVTSSLALNFIPEPEAALDEMRRITASGGVVSACVWDYAGRMEFLRHFWDCAAALDRNARDLDEGLRFPICRPESLEALFRGCRLRQVLCDAIEVTTRFGRFAEFWTPFLGGTGPAPSYVSSLGSAQREALATRLDHALPREPDGTISLVARAWAVRGIVD
jgi:SAM-dependent methyltransferase